MTINGESLGFRNASHSRGSPQPSQREPRFTAYAGYKQDIGETVGIPVCELVADTANLLMETILERRNDG